MINLISNFTSPDDNKLPLQVTFGGGQLGITPGLKPSRFEPTPSSAASFLKSLSTTSSFTVSQFLLKGCPTVIYKQGKLNWIYRYR